MSNLLSARTDSPGASGFWKVVPFPQGLHISINEEWLSRLIGR